RRICEIAIPEFKQVAAHREIGNDILAKIGSEYESIATRAAGHRVIARAAGDGVVPGRARDRIISAGAAYRRIGVDRREIPDVTIGELDLLKAPVCGLGVELLIEGDGLSVRMTVATRCAPIRLNVRSLAFKSVRRRVSTSVVEPDSSLM